MIRILNAAPLNYCDEARRILRSFALVDEAPLDYRKLLECIGGYDALIVRLGLQVDRPLIDAAGQLRAIASATTGLDHIDVVYAAQKGIAVLSLKEEPAFMRTIPASAELTWAILISLMRKVPAAFASVCAGKWDRDAYRGHDLRGKRLGVLGLGRIGEMVARYGLAFEMSVAAYDPYREDWMEGVQRCQSLEDLLRSSDILSVHVPLNDQTRRMIGREQLERLPQGAVVVNTARGGIFVEEDLLAALESGRLAGAALDVICGERGEGFPGASALVAYACSHDNLLITPHIGGATVESMAATEVFIAQKLRRHFME